MTDYVIIQTRDRTGRTHIYWYPDTATAEAGDCMAHVASGVLYVDGAMANFDVAQCAFGLYSNELLHDPWQDLSWITTHTRDGDGYIVAITRTLGGAA